MPDFIYIYDQLCLSTSFAPARFWDLWDDQHCLAITKIVNVALEEAAVTAERMRFKAPEAIRALKLKEPGHTPPPTKAHHDALSEVLTQAVNSRAFVREALQAKGAKVEDAGLQFLAVEIEGLRLRVVVEPA